MIENVLFQVTIPEDFLFLVNAIEEENLEKAVNKIEIDVLDDVQDGLVLVEGTYTDRKVVKEVDSLDVNVKMWVVDVETDQDGRKPLD